MAEQAINTTTCTEGACNGSEAGWGKSTSRFTRLAELSPYSSSVRNSHPQNQLSHNVLKHEN